MSTPNSSKMILFGIFWMLLSGLSFVAVIGLVRYLGDALPATVSAFIRCAIGLAFFFPYLVRLPKNSINKNNLPRYMWRGVLHSLAIVFWFFAMTRLPVAEVTAIGYMTPVFVTIGAVLLFKESISFWRIFAILVAFLGVLVILRPGIQDFTLGRGSQFCATLFFAGSFLMAKSLTKTEDSTTIVAMMTLFVTISLAPIAFFTWVTPAFGSLIILIFVALFATLAHLAMTKAISIAPLVVIQPITFLQLIWSVLLGVFVFDERLDIWVIVGGVLIILAITLISFKERNNTDYSRLSEKESRKIKSAI